MHQLRVVVLPAEFDQRAMVRPFRRVRMGMPAFLSLGLGRHGRNASRPNHRSQSHRNQPVRTFCQSHRILLCSQKHTGHSAANSS